MDPKLILNCIQEGVKLIDSMLNPEPKSLVSTVIDLLNPFAPL